MKGINTMSAKQLIEAMQDEGRLPADLIRDWITNVSKPGSTGQSLREDVGGDVELPNTPADPMQTHPQEEPVSIEASTLTFTVESAEQQTYFKEMVNALDAAQVDYKLGHAADDQWLLTWMPDQDQAIDNVLEGLGIEYEEDDTPEAVIDYYGHGAEQMGESELAIEALLHGASSDEIIDVVCEAKKKAKAYKPKGWLGKAVKKGGKEFKTTAKYPTAPEAKRAIIAGLLKKMGKASTSGGQ
jgi:hypothetical protein